MVTMSSEHRNAEGRPDLEQTLVAADLHFLWGADLPLVFLSPAFWLHGTALSYYSPLPWKPSETRLASSNQTLANAGVKYKLKATGVIERATELQRS